MFKQKNTPAPSPETVLDRMFAETLDKHRYERLEWDVSWTNVTTMKALTGFVAPRLMPGDTPLPRDYEGVYCGVPVYLDRQLQDGVIEIRDMHGAVLATAEFNGGKL
jgi:hypothetical protein